MRSFRVRSLGSNKLYLNVLSLTTKAARDAYLQDSENQSCRLSCSGGHFDESTRFVSQRKTVECASEGVTLLSSSRLIRTAVSDDSDGWLMRRDRGLGHRFSGHGKARRPAWRRRALAGVHLEDH